MAEGDPAFPEAERRQEDCQRQNEWTVEGHLKNRPQVARAQQNQTCEGDGHLQHV